MNEHSIVENIRPGSLIQPRRKVWLYIVPGEGDEQDPYASNRLEAQQGDYLMVLTPVAKKPIGYTGSQRIFRYQIFALHSEKIVSFTCTAIDSRLIDEAFEIIETDDPNI